MVHGREGGHAYARKFSLDAVTAVSPVNAFLQHVAAGTRGLR
jgi:hypothetical protein